MGGEKLRLTREIKKILHDIYHGSGEGAFSSATNVFRIAKRKLPKLTLSVVRDYLNSLRSYALHRRAVRKFERRSFLAIAPWDTFSIDLFFLSSEKKRGRKNVGLLVIDSFSKYIWAKELKDKTGDSVLRAFTAILDRLKRNPLNLFCDKVHFQ